MKVLFFDCCSGISGDMVLGALLDLGINENVFRRELGKLDLPGYSLIIRKAQKDWIRGTDVTIVQGHAARCTARQAIEQSGKHEHNYCCNSNSGTACSEEEHLEGEDISGHNWYSGDTCSIPDIEKLINGSSLRQSVKDFSIRVFREIARAEAKVYSKSMDEVSFHKTRAVDSIVHIVGTRICIDLLGINKIFSSPLYDGKGFVKHCNEIIPIPSPVVVEMLSGSGVPLKTMDINMEIVTPTGMGLLKCMASDFGNMPAMIINRVGYGIGKREIGRPDALRVVQGDLLGEMIMEEENEMDDAVPLTIGIDDKCPEIPDYVV
jgi:uncharacterized protein (DUF111 family)